MSSGGLWGFLSKNRSATATLAILGGLWTTYQAYGLLCSSYLHFVRPSSLKRYRDSVHGPNAAWALVTGSSDGLGKSFAEELCHRGFNVVIHGRNPKKLEAVKSELLEQWPQRQVKILVLDAASAAADPAQMSYAAQELRGINLKVLVNNIGGNGGQRPLWIPLQEYGEDRTRLFLDITSRFPTELTRCLLPILINDSPALIINIGSFVSELPSPYISVYGAAKAYNKVWSRSLAFEMDVEDHDVEVMHIMVGMVSTSMDPRPISLLVPSARKMASVSLDKVGCGRDVVFGYWPHELQYHLMVDLPRWIRDSMLMQLVRKMKEDEEKDLKSQ